MRLGLECQWTNPHATFINQTADTVVAAGTKSLPSSVAKWRPLPGVRAAPLLNCIPHSARQFQYNKVFWDSYLPKGCPPPPDMTISSTARWLKSSPSEDRHDVRFGLAMSAVSCCMIGARQKDDALFGEGLWFYGQVMQTLREKLHDIVNLDSRTRLAMLHTTVFLSLFEVCTAHILPRW